MAVLLTKISPDTYKLVKNWCAPNKPKEKSFAELVKLVKDHLCPKPSETMERCKFRQMQQGPTETIADFIARLKNATVHCNFADLSTVLRDQLVCGLRSHSIRAILFREENLTYEKAYKLAVAAEAAEINATSTDNFQVASNADVHVLREGQNKRGRQSGRGGSRGRGRGRGGRDGGERQQPEPGNCYCCGGPNHMAKHCFHRFKTCTACQKRGHIEAACRTKQNNVQQVEAAEGKEEATEDNYDSDFMVIKGNENTETVIDSLKVAGKHIKAEPMALKVRINQVNIEMKVDTGAYIAAMSKNTKEKLFSELKIEKLHTSFNAYGKVRLEHEGIIKGLNVKQM